ncbi:hypothetical protein HanXRQr2_Chr01g0020031 [Helianthus annuus]|uniref:Uncharacterized protein n=1 Tax=Helianthus annuus TaxID=4232 RepID=A0A9K3P2Y1_HELAN|nr:hypothetical protein HanXRQr2_Chr01g0020031 [Helianthus annuus]
MSFRLMVMLLLYQVVTNFVYKTPNLPTVIVFLQILNNCYSHGNLRFCKNS